VHERLALPAGAQHEFSAAGGQEEVLARAIRKHTPRHFLAKLIDLKKRFSFEKRQRGRAVDSLIKALPLINNHNNSQIN